MKHYVRTQIQDILLFSNKRLQEVKNLTLYSGILSNFRFMMY